MIIVQRPAAAVPSRGGSPVENANEDSHRAEPPGEHRIGRDNIIEVEAEEIGHRRLTIRRRGKGD